MAVGVDKQLDLIDFSGGLNTDSSTFTMKMNESPDLLNVRLDPLGPVSGRNGVERLNDSAGYSGFEAFAVKTLHRYYRVGTTPIILLTINNKLLKITRAAPSSTTEVGTIQADVAWETAQMNGYVFLTNRASRPLKTNGDAVYILGEKPTETVTPADGAGAETNIPAGTYYYVFTRVYKTTGLPETGESPASAQLSWTLAVPGDIQLTFPAIPRNDILNWNIYRSLAGQANGPYYFVGSHIGGVVPSTFQDDVAPEALVDKVDLQRVEPPKAAICCVHQNRLWLAKLTELTGQMFNVDLIASDVGKPEQFRAISTRYKAENTSGEEIRGMYSYGGMLVVTTMTHVFAVVGTGAEGGPTGDIPDYRVVLLARGPGAMSHRVMQGRHGLLFMTNKTDVWQMRGQEITSLSDRRVNQYLSDNLDQSRSDLSIGVCTEKDYRVTFPAGASLYPNRTIIYNYRADGFVVDDHYTLASYAYLDGETDLLELLAGEANGATGASYLYKMDSDGFNSDWNPVAKVVANFERRYITSDLSLANTFAETATYRLLGIECSAFGASLIVSAFLDHDNSEVLLGVINFSESTTEWDEFSWDNANWSGANQIRKTSSLPQGTIGNRIAIKLLQNSLNGDPFRVELITLGGQLKGIRASADGSPN